MLQNFASFISRVHLQCIRIYSRLALEIKSTKLQPINYYNTYVHVSIKINLSYLLQTNPMCIYSPSTLIRPRLDALYLSLFIPSDICSKIGRSKNVYEDAAGAQPPPGEGYQMV